MIEPIASRPLDDGIWRAWQHQNRDRDARGLALRMKLGKWLLLVVLPAAVLLWFFLDRVR